MLYFPTSLINVSGPHCETENMEIVSFHVIVACRFSFLSPPLRGLGATCDDYLRLIGKHIVDFLLVFTRLFSLGVMAEELQANIGSKSAISFQRGPADPKFHVEGVAPTNHSSSQEN